MEDMYVSSLGAAWYRFTQNLALYRQSNGWFYILFQQSTIVPWLENLNFFTSTNKIIYIVNNSCLFGLIKLICMRIWAIT